MDYFIKALHGAELMQQVYDLGRCMNNEITEMRDLTVPEKYKYKYGVDRASSLARLLESYHQLRLKDDADVL